jgi:hypothetical protein
MANPRRPWQRRALVTATVLTGIETAVVARRRGRLMAMDTVVRCRRGHLFTTWWLPGASVKAVRLGWWRLQRCPVGGHLGIVTPVRVAELTDEERQRAAQTHDRRLP